MITTVTFKQNTVTVKNKYACECGHKFTRQSSDWFTMSPFNKLTVAENRENIKGKLLVIKKICPKCKRECSPIPVTNKTK